LIKALSSQAKFNTLDNYFQIHPECPGELEAALWKIRAGRDTLSLFFAALNF
jgi:hypothetical protein